MDLILDTCGLLSLSGCSEKQLSPDTLRKIETCANLFISSYSFWEICLKHHKGNLPLKPFPDATVFWNEGKNTYQFIDLAVTSRIFEASIYLPPHHRDPVDRVVIAEALARNIPIVTYDPLFTPYGVSTLA